MDHHDNPFPLYRKTAIRKGERCDLNVKPIPHFKPREIQHIRKTMGATQAQFANLLGVNTNSITTWEAGIRPPSKTARRLIQLLESDPHLYRHITAEEESPNDG